MKYILAWVMLMCAAPVWAETALFAGGCFWCMEAEFQEVKGVSGVVSGYTGGERANPTYEEVSTGTTGHVEAVQVTYDPAQISYERLLDIFWGNVDPTDEKGQFCDKGSQYSAGIFYHTEKEHALAEQSKKQVEAKIRKPVAAFVREAKAFYPAEAYHQDYYKTHAAAYQSYKKGCRGK